MYFRKLLPEKQVYGDIKAFLVFPVTAGFHFFKRVSDPGFHFIEKYGAKRITEERIVKVIDITPETSKKETPNSPHE